MKKKIIIAVIGLAVLIGIIAGIKGLQIGKMMGQKRPVLAETVTATIVEPQNWESALSSVGSLVAVQGVTVSAEMAGKVAHIAFEPGSAVQAGDLLVQQDVAAETAQLRSAEATMALAKVNFERARSLLAQKTYSRAEYDSADAQYKQAVAQVDNLKAVIAKKTIKAPFSGMLGIRLVNLGQILSAGDAIVSLQSLDPIHVNFSLPQQQLAQIRTGFLARVISDAVPGKMLEGPITAINPQVDAATRNILVQATIDNHEMLMRPGMFVNVTVVLPEQQTVLAIPATAVLNAPYSDSVFIVENAAGDNSTAPGKVARQQFVRLGQRRGDYVAITAGVKEGDMIVSTGVFKLRNGQAVAVDNTLAPAFSLAPTPADR
ncbi:MAG: efflux RND transporter periplasmic adaptor subunit [Deltaproteobacteria bacterium]|nr:efflux RND transporter periplasmic adaptor subunit [Deltaproteobacteria bacterium]